MLLASSLGFSPYEIISYLGKFIALMFVLSLHEFAHAFVAYKNGDPTAKNYGRCSINPFVHFDIVGLVCFMLCGFGWAKPVPINPNNFNKYKKGCIEVSLAGVIMNYIISFLCYPLLILSLAYLPDMLMFDELIACVFLFGYSLSLCFCVFNLLPFYPLDGFNFIDSISKRKGKVLYFLRVYGQYILLALILINWLSTKVYVFEYINVLGWVMSFAMDVLAKPITLFWGLIF